jgi:hypothetical protein
MKLKMTLSIAVIAISLAVFSQTPRDFKFDAPDSLIGKERYLHVGTIKGLKPKDAIRFAKQLHIHNAELVLIERKTFQDKMQNIKGVKGFQLIEIKVKPTFALPNCIDIVLNFQPLK